MSLLTFIASLFISVIVIGGTGGPVPIAPSLPIFIRDDLREVTLEEELLLADLLGGEMYGVGRNYGIRSQKATDTAASILSTVEWRLRYRYISDGTVFGTLDWGIDRGNPQFLPCVTRGWPGTCLEQDKLGPYREQVRAYSEDTLQVSDDACLGYSNYHSIPGDKLPCDCQLEFPEIGQRMCFYTTYWAQQHTLR